MNSKQGDFTLAEVSIGCLKILLNCHGLELNCEQGGFTLAELFISFPKSC